MNDKEKIVNSVVNMLKVNMGLKNDEKVLVVTDVPKAEEWKTKTSAKLKEAVERSVLAKMVEEIAVEEFPKNPVEFYTYPSVGKHGTYPGKEVEEKMKNADVTIAITTYSLTHTDARLNTCKAGGRVASMPLFLAEMFSEGGPMAADYRAIDKETRKIAEWITKANDVKITSPGGTDISFSVKGRNGMVDTGIFTEKGSWGNLPSGEAYTTPVEGTASGKLVVEPKMYADLKEKMTLIFKNGNATGIIGGGKIGDEFRALLDFNKKEEPYISRRNLAELGIGTNPNAKRPDNLLECEKIRGTIHLAVGDNFHMGGKVSADLHQDFIISKPTWTLDGKAVMKDGKLLA